jgi:hypothetical protein
MIKASFLLAVLAIAFAAWGFTNQVEIVPSANIEVVETPHGNAYLNLDADGHAVILTGQLAQREERGTLNYYAPSPRIERRLRELRELNDKLTPKPPPVPDTVIIVNQQQTQTMRVDRARHPYQRRRARHYRPSGLP